MGCSCGKKKVAGGSPLNKVVKPSGGSVNRGGSGPKTTTKKIRRIIRRASR